MEKHFFFFDGAALGDVIGFALENDEGSRTRDHRYFSEYSRLWILRELLINPKRRYIECFELSLNNRNEWGMRGWGEEEDIPHTDCPLELLAAANCAINVSWRQKVLSRQGALHALPVGCWLHSTTGMALPTGEVCHDFRYLGRGTFLCADGQVVRFSPEEVARLTGEGGGIAMGRA